jgi:hypothetical protein
MKRHSANGVAPALAEQPTSSSTVIDLRVDLRDSGIVRVDLRDPSVPWIMPPEDVASFDKFEWTPQRQAILDAFRAGDLD